MLWTKPRSFTRLRRRSFLRLFSQSHWLIFFNELNSHSNCCCFNSSQSLQSRNFIASVQSVSLSLLSQAQTWRGLFRLCSAALFLLPGSPPSEEPTDGRKVAAPPHAVLTAWLWKISAVSVCCLSLASLSLHVCFRTLGRCGPGKTENRTRRGICLPVVFTEETPTGTI